MEETKKKMRFAEKTVDSVNADYWFLRDNGVKGRIALLVVGIAYKEEKRRKNVE